MGPGGIPKGGAKGMCVLDGGTECCTGLRKEALAMETWGHIPFSPHPGCVPLASQLPSLSLEGLLCRIRSNQLTGYYVGELGEGPAGWLCTQALESIVWV